MEKEKKFLIPEADIIDFQKSNIYGDVDPMLASGVGADNDEDLPEH